LFTGGHLSRVGVERGGRTRAGSSGKWRVGVAADAIKADGVVSLFHHLQQTTTAEGESQTRMMLETPACAKIGIGTLCAPPVTTARSARPDFG
jgi:hypothetical protein